MFLLLVLLLPASVLYFIPPSIPSCQSDFRKGFLVLSFCSLVSLAVFCFPTGSDFPRALFGTRTQALDHFSLASI
jgi:hypothetical protein